jgi:hypothetical protein
MGRSTGCSSHRAALGTFVERAERGPATAAALDHLERCRRCEAELAETLLTIHALRRMLDPARVADPPPDGWDRLRGRVATPVHHAVGVRTSLAALAVSAGLVAALIGPVAVFRTIDAVEQEPGAAPAVVSARTTADQRAEAAFLSRARAERTPRADSVPATAPSAAWPGPDGLGRPATVARIVVPLERAD